MAGSVIATLPIVVVFFLAQKYFVQGIVTSGLKG
jgi:multiple sugar transport system permease protein